MGLWEGRPALAGAIGVAGRRFPGAAALGFLFAAGAVCYGGPLLLRLGFYHDDWTLLSHMAFSRPGFVGAMEGLAREASTQLMRPLTIPLWAGLYTIFGLQPAGWQAALLAVNVLLAYAVFRLLGRYGVGRRLALLGAALLLAFPNKDATMFWPFVIICSLSLLFWLEAFLAHLRFVEGGRARDAGLAGALLLSCFATYDQCLLLAPLWLAVPGARPRDIPRRAWQGFALAAGLTAAYLAYKFLAAPALAGHAYNQSLDLSPRRLWVIASGAAAAFLGAPLARAMAQGLEFALRRSPAVAAAGLLLPWAALALPRGRRPLAEGRRGGPDRALWALAAGFFALGLAPLVPSTYRLEAAGVFDRLNEVPALGAVLAATAALAAAPGRWPPRAAAGAAGLLLAVHAGFAGIWAESWSLQLDLRRMVLREAAGWPAGTTLLVYLPIRSVLGRAPIFDAHWDITGAVQLWTGDRSRRAETLNGGIRWTESGLLVRGSTVPYAATRFLDAREGRIVETRYEALQALPQAQGTLTSNSFSFPKPRTRKRSNGLGEGHGGPP